MIFWLYPVFSRPQIMGKDKLRRFAEMTTFQRVFQPQVNYHSPDHELKGNWNEKVFLNHHPIVLEIGCGKGEYTVGLAQRYPEKNFIGIDIKGARIWRGAKTINDEQICNAAFLRIRMETIQKFFNLNEVSEIWITFPDPQPREAKENKRLSSLLFLKRYATFLKPDGIIHLKTDNFQLWEYTCNLAKNIHAKVIAATNDLYSSTEIPINLDIKTAYERKYLSEGKPICYLAFRLPDDFTSVQSTEEPHQLP